MPKKGQIQYYDPIGKDWVNHSNYHKKSTAKKHIFCLRTAHSETQYRIRRNKKQANSKRWDAIF